MSCSRLLFFLLVFLQVVGCTAQKEKPVSGTIQAGGLRIYYERQGKGEALLLLHAGLQNSSMWQEQVKDLSTRFQVVTIDLPFHGRTTGSDTAILAKEVVKTVLDSLHLQRVSLAGLSMGASVAQDFVIGYPGRVNKAVFISAGVNGFERKFPIDSLSKAWYSLFSGALAAGDTARAALEFTKAWGEGVHHRGDNLTKEASRYVYETTLATLRQHRLQGWPNLQDEPPALEGIPSIRVPVLIVHGDQDLPYIAVASRYLEQNIRGAKRVQLAGAAHMLNMEQPTEVNRLLRTFLEAR